MNDGVRYTPRRVSLAFHDTKSFLCVCVHFMCMRVSADVVADRGVDGRSE